MQTLDMKSRDELLESIAVLKFALKRAGVPASDYLIALKDMPVDGDDQLCLIELADGSWISIYAERGARKRLNTFQRAADAMDFFYWRLTRATKFSTFRTEWENAEGGR